LVSRCAGWLSPSLMPGVGEGGDPNIASCQPRLAKNLSQIWQGGNIFLKPGFHNVRLLFM